MPGGSSSSCPASAVTLRQWIARLPMRAACCWKLKLLLTLILSVFFCVPYFLIGNFPLFPVHDLPLSWIDRAIGFHPTGWVWIYQSIYILTNIIPWLARSRDDLLRYLRGFVILCSISFVIFFFAPIRAPKPHIAAPSGMYWVLQLYDVPINSLPSLHAGWLVYSLCFGRRIFENDLPKGVAALCLIWSGLILYGTLATKEHYLIDLVAGAVLAIAVHTLVWRNTKRVTAGRARERAISGSPLPAES